MKFSKLVFPGIKRTDRKTGGLFHQPIKPFLWFSPGVVIFMMILSLTTSCEKDSDTGSFNYDHLYNKKWLTISQTTTPIWTYPATGKSYTDLWDFAKEIFPCVTDDYDVYQRHGVFYANHAQMRCDPNQPELAPPTYFLVDKEVDSIYLVVPLEVPGQAVQILNIRSKVLELTADRMVVRYNQVVPFTNTLQNITQTYKAIP